MRTVPPEMTRLWLRGGPFIGDEAAPHGRVTVEEDWYLNTEYNVETPDPTKLPFRWFQREDNSQVETEIPNIKSINIDRSLDSPAATCRLSMYNTTMDLNTEGKANYLGQPGAYTWRVPSRSARARWNQIKGRWNDVLVPNALLRTYQGYGGKDKDLATALADGNLVLTGVWLIDKVRPGTDGMLEIECRDMMKLLIEQQLYLPLVPSDWYPLHYQRFIYTYILQEEAPVYDFTDPIENSPVPVEGPKYVPDIAINPRRGYWILGSDGGVFAEGAPFYGSRGGGQASDHEDTAPMVGIGADPLGSGYWLASANGGVFSFGGVPFYGSLANETLSAPIVDIAVHPSGRGYWLVGRDGAVYAFGACQYLGGKPNTNGRPIVDIEANPTTGLGYWLLDDHGGVYTFGDAPFFGSVVQDNQVPNNPTVWQAIQGMASRPQGDGYWIVAGNGDVYTYGAAPYLNVTQANTPKSWAEIQQNLNDPIFDIATTPSGNGYYMVGGDGGVFCFGDANFYGSLPRRFTWLDITDGNYRDYSDIIKDLLLWSGFLLQGTGTDDVYGNIETTGAYAQYALPQEQFDKKSVLDAINSIKEIVGYHFWVDDEGAARFESPNWFRPGNFMEDGTHVSIIPEIDEMTQLTEYSAVFADTDMRSELTVSSYAPEADNSTTVTTRKKLEIPGVDIVRGMVRPAMWIDQNFKLKEEQETMIDLLALQIYRSLRQGQVTCVGYPALQINDQVQLQERNTAETYVHYIRGLSSTMDLDEGTYTMNLRTNWLVNDQLVFGDEDD